MAGAIRPDDWNLPLLIHVLGAMMLVGALVLAGAAMALAWRNGSAPLARLSYRALLLGAIPSWILMRAGAEWIASKEDLTADSDLSWISIGFTTADAGIVVLLVATLCAGLALRRARRNEGAAGLGRASAVLVSLLVVAYVVVIWAMTTKPI